MSIRIGNSCSNCEHLTQSNTCSVHLVSVNPMYTCNSFVMKESIKNDRNCITCVRYEAPLVRILKKLHPRCLAHTGLHKTRLLNQSLFLH